MTEISTTTAQRPSFTLGYVANVLMFVCAPAGVILAYIDRPKADAVLASHYSYLIGTFWKGMLYWFVAFLLTFLVIGILVMFAAGLWYIARCVKSVVYLSRGEAIGNPGSWLL
ncbi:MAG: hypothetical protein EOP18_03560 [Rhizobiaceae bacterium]|nr:MAG: hypothetical protein EOP18_03560 [Rhizobiaceae bacterium]